MFQLQGDNPFKRVKQRRHSQEYISSFGHNYSIAGISKSTQ